MPFSGSTVLLLFAIVLALIGATVAPLVLGAVACLIEAYVIYRSGRA